MLIYCFICSILFTIVLITFVFAFFIGIKKKKELEKQVDRLVKRSMYED